MEDKKTINEIIHIENEFNKYANVELKRAKEHFKSLEQHQIYKKDGTLLKYVEDGYTPNKNLKVLPLKKGDNVSTQIFLSANYKTSFNLFIKLCFSGGSYEEHDKARDEWRKATQETPSDNKSLSQYRQKTFKLYKHMNDIKPYTIYKEEYLTIGDLENGTLKSVSEFKAEPLLNADEQFNQYKKVLRLKNDFLNEKDKLTHKIRELV